MKSFSVPVVATFLVANALSGIAETEHWPQYRGAASDGIGEGATLPDNWSETENVVWRKQVPGWGWSSPVVWGKRVFVTSAMGQQDLPTPEIGGYPGGHLIDEGDHRWMVHCLDFDSGETIWSATAHEGPPKEKRHPRNSYASETPATDGERVVAYFANHGVYSYTMDGELEWHRPYDAYPMRDGWNSGASPIIHEDVVYIQNDSLAQSFIEALDKRTGAVLWRTDRDEPSTWSTPYVWENALRTEVVTIGTNRVRSYDPENGSVLWELQGTSGLVSLMPLAKDGLLYVGAGYHYGPLYAIRPGASGDISLKAGEDSNEWIVWHQRRGSSIHPCYLVRNGRLYVCYDSGLFACFDAQTGEEIYGRQRLDTKGGRFYASPFAYHDRIFLLNENGDTYVIRDGPEFEILGKNSVGDVAWATPAIAGGSLFLRTYSWLYRLENKEKSVPPSR